MAGFGDRMDGCRSEGSSGSKMPPMHREQSLVTGRHTYRGVVIVGVENILRELQGGCTVYGMDGSEGWRGRGCTRHRISIRVGFTDQYQRGTMADECSRLSALVGSIVLAGGS